jgi:hypothetical protein
MIDIQALYAERTKLNTRLLELDVQETEWSRQYYCNNIPTSMQDRSTLVAERARIKLRLNAINNAIYEAKFAGVGKVQV